MTPHASKQRQSRRTESELEFGSGRSNVGDTSSEMVQTESRSEGTDSLERVEPTKTVADHVDFETLDVELPSEWSVHPNLVQFGEEPLAETVSFRRTIVDPQLVLKPVNSADPTGEIDIYERSGPRASRRHTMTVGPLSDAIRVAVNRIHQLDD